MRLFIINRVLLVTRYSIIEQSAAISFLGQKNMDHTFDIAIIGGGINGCGCAADASLRGLSVVLLEQDDLASKTSSSSTKLIHGGLRYLEYYEFALVKKALEERQTLLDMAPHLVHPQAFILPYEHHMRPSWLLRIGLFIYDHLSRKNRLPQCKSINRSDKNPYFFPLRDGLKKGFHFYDAATDDSRLSIANALQAKNHGASIRPYSKVIAADVIDNIWHLTIQPKQGTTYTVRAKTLINAGGPWVKSIADLTQTPVHHEISLVKGSHILLPKLYEGKHAYLLQHEDKRIVFVIPYHGLSMIGTTDVSYQGDLNQIQISQDEIEYLIALVNSYFAKEITAKEVIYSWSGVRPLLASEGKEAKSLSRDYHYEYSHASAPTVSIFGGKITTYRQLAEDIIDQLIPIFPHMGHSKTKTTPLPGATLGTMNFEEYALYARTHYNWLDEHLLNRYLYSYGSAMEIFLAPCSHPEALGQHFGSSLYQVEVDYLIAHEWAKQIDDILLRRTKLGLRMDRQSQKNLARYLSEATKELMLI